MTIPFEVTCSAQAIVRDQSAVKRVYTQIACQRNLGFTRSGRCFLGPIDSPSGVPWIVQTLQDEQLGVDRIRGRGMS